ncbi:venom serine protease-like [Uranotaenia lowii]|uniref:venom serine protease-like n=1 Tax=Uranotaenia lowii TaxID=190385 RepID=UPI00247A9E00|nr:venom serine protease-like [Uranotaenia lowii]
MGWRRICFFLIALVPLVAGQSYVGCDYVYNYVENGLGYIQSPNYPNYYSPGVNCRFTINAPNNYFLYAQFYDVVLPSSSNCAYDKLIIAQNGVPSLTGALWKCGAATFDVASTGNKLVVTLHTWPFANNPGGRFRAQISAVPFPCNCGLKKKPLIVGGVTTQVNEFPMAAAIMSVSSSTTSLVCGATIITDQHAITAAHCLKGRSIAATSLLVGGHDIKKYNSTPSAVLMPISTFTLHPSFNPTLQTNDIALVRTMNKIVFNAAVGRACLPFMYASDTLVGKELDTLGWGTLDYGGPMPTYLQKVKLPVISQATCKAKMTNLIDAQFCTYIPAKDSCQYDSGGPMLYSNPTTSKAYAVGVINYGAACAAGYPSVSSRISSFLPWIEANTNFNFCEKNVN